MIRTCPSCGHERQPEDVAPAGECPKCGVIFAKLLEAASAGADARIPERPRRAEHSTAAMAGAGRTARPAAPPAPSPATQPPPSGARGPVALDAAPAPAGDGDGGGHNAATVPCPTCGRQVAYGARSCPGCGKRNPAPRLSRPVSRKHVIGAGAVLLLLVAIGATQRDEPAPTPQQNLIAAQRDVDACAAEIGVDPRGNQTLYMRHLQALSDCLRRKGYRLPPDAARR